MVKTACKHICTGMCEEEYLLQRAKTQLQFCLLALDNLPRNSVITVTSLGADLREFNNSLNGQTSREVSLSENA